MKNLLFALFALLSFYGFSQVPVMNPINGASVVCSSPAPAVVYSTSASNSPTSYSWSVISPSPGVIISNPTSSVTSITFPYSNGVYTVNCYAVNGSGSSLIETKIVSVFETPSVTFSGANTFCQGSSTFLSASSTALMSSPTINYFWSPPTGLNTTFGQNVIANPTVATVYTVTAVLNSCSGTNTIGISPMISPTVTANVTNSSVCAGQSVIFTGSGASTYYWTNGVIDGAPFTPGFSNMYMVTGYLPNGCYDTDYIPVIVNPLPSISVSTSTNVLCQGQSAILIISGNAATYSLNSVLSSQTVIVTPSSSAIYTVSGTSLQGCTVNDLVQINVSVCIGINEHTNSSHLLDIYPIPSSKEIYIRTGSDADIEIFNASGQLLRKYNLKENEVIKLDALNTGFYYVRNKNEIKKFIIVKD